MISVNSRLSGKVTARDLYGLYSQSFAESGGSHWPLDRFMRKLPHWDVIGNPHGFVAFREHDGGVRKIVCAAGDPETVKGLMADIVREDRPLWGTVSERLASAACRYGFIAPHTLPDGHAVVADILSKATAGYFGGLRVIVRADGKLNIDYDDWGGITKCIIANQHFLDLIAETPNVNGDYI